MTKKLTGTGVALVTPFTADKKVDYTALQQHVKFVTDNKVDYLVALGTTAETPTLSAQEKSEIVKTVIHANTAKLPIVLGIGGNDTQHVVENVKSTDFTDIDVLLSVTPYYNKPGQAGLCKHYEMIANVSPVPVMLYNVPGRTGVNLSVESTLTLAQHPNICGIKDASGNITQTGYILRKKPIDFLVISGDDSLSLPQIAIGASGVISVVANLLPLQFSTMVNLGLQGDFNKASKIHLELLPVIDAIFAEGNPTGVKAGLAILQQMTSTVRLPLVSAGESLIQQLQQLITKP